jgi:DNA polymerase-3 subunit delta'
VCPSCQKIAAGNHPDVRVIVGEGAGESIKIDQVRALQHEAMLLPYEGRYRIFILRRMDLASMEAANSLLKTLEEPPAHVVLILTAVQAEALPATVVSRCQRLDLRPITVRQVADALRDRGVASDKAELLARLSSGRIGWAIQASEREEPLAQRQRGLEQLMQLLSARRVERFDFASKASRDPASCRDLIELWAVWWRDLLLLRTAGGDHLVNLDQADEIGQVVDKIDLSQARAVLAALEATAAQLDANVNTRLALEGLLLKLPRWDVAPNAAGRSSP